MDRESDSHKGENGKVGVIGGSVDFSGAPALSGQATLRSGADLVKILTSDHVKYTVAGFSENLIVEGYDSEYFGEESVQKAERLDHWADCIVVGPGLGNVDQDALKDFLENAESPLVIDAEAIQTAVRSDILNVVLTPHRGEAEIIRGEFGTIQEFIEMKDDIVVLEKGPEDRIYSESQIKKVSGGHPGMTVGGTGDVLTGIVAALIAQGMNKEEAAKKAAEVNSKAGEKAAEKFGKGLVATDLLEEIPKVLFKG
jgi:ADP-dependent NAD(P)H-hydrate dehydratase